MAQPESERFNSPAALAWNSRQAEQGSRNALGLAHFARERGQQAEAQIEDRPIRQVGICGAGIMGTGIAAANLRQRVPVRLYDAASSAVSRAVAQLQQQSQGWGPGAAAAEPTASGLPPVLGCQNLEDLSGCDLVIETVVENRELKQQILARLSASLDKQALLASNTSTIAIAALAASLPRPERFCGLHFCNPVSERQLVEIVRGPQTSAETLAAAVSYATRIGKLPIVVRDAPGFLVNRLLLPYLNEALNLLCQGAGLLQIDQAARQFGMPLGPLEMFDMIGVDTAMRAGRTLWEAFPDRIALTPLLPALVKRERLGQKTGVGFYRYTSHQGRGEPDPQLSAILEPYVRGHRQFTDTEIVLRLFLPMLVEATQVLEERVVEDPRDVDLGLLYGLAFPAFKGGLLHWVDQLGAATVIELFRPFAGGGKHMSPPPLLLEMATSGSRFYEPLSAPDPQIRSSQGEA